MKNGEQLLMVMMICGTALFGCASQEVEEVEEPKTEQKVEVKKPEKVTYNDMIEAIEWEMVQDEYGDTTVTGKLTNTSDKEIEYIEIEYKFVLDGVTVESSFTNAVNIEPNETIRVEIYTCEEFNTMQVKDSEADEWITVDVVVQQVEEKPIEQEVTEQEITKPVEEVEEEPVAQAEENGIWGDSEPQYEDLQTTKIKLVEDSDDKVLMLYDGTILDYANDVIKETNGESVDYELTSQLLMVGFCSIGEPEKPFTLVDKEGTVIYSYLNGEPVENGLEKLQ